MYDSTQTIEECAGEDMNKLLDLAKTYVGTPHINGGDVKGAGLDCCTLVTNFYAELGHKKIKVKFGYSADWYCQKDCEELLLPYLEKHFVRTKCLMPGYLVSYRWGHSKYAHLAIYLGKGMLLHCDADDGTSITNIDDPKFTDALGKSRITGFWRPKHGVI